jgi:hypothetical protein
LLLGQGCLGWIIKNKFQSAQSREALKDIRIFELEEKLYVNFIRTSL